MGFRSYPHLSDAPSQLADLAQQIPDDGEIKYHDEFSQLAKASIYKPPRRRGMRKVEDFGNLLIAESFVVEIIDRFPFLAVQGL